MVGKKRIFRQPLAKSQAPQCRGPPPLSQNVVMLGKTHPQTITNVHAFHKLTKKPIFQPFHASHGTNLWWSGKYRWHASLGSMPWPCVALLCGILWNMYACTSRHLGASPQKWWWLTWPLVACAIPGVAEGAFETSITWGKCVPLSGTMQCAWWCCVHGLNSDMMRMRKSGRSCEASCAGTKLWKTR